jgi:uncharacterized protein YjbI with pentapeptide repeats
MADSLPTLPPALQAEINAQLTARRDTAARLGRLPPFHGRSWAGGDFSGTAWTSEDFTDCDLHGADFRGCTFYDADLRCARLHDADLRDSDFTGARHLLPKQFAGADLTRAQLPDTIAAFPALAHSDRLSENAAKVFFTFLLAMVFAVVTSAGIRDFDLINNRGTAKLPVLDVEVPALHFMWGASLLLCILFLYLHIYLQRLWEVLATLPAILPDGRNLDQATHPWLLNDLCRDHIIRLRRQRHHLAKIQNCVCGLLAYVFPAFAMVYLWAKGLRTQDPWLIWPQFVFLAVVIATSPCFSIALRGAFTRERATLSALLPFLRKPFVRACLLVGTVLVLGSFLITCAQVTSRDLPPIIGPVFTGLGGRRYADVKGSEFSERPKDWPGLTFATTKDLAKVSHTSYENVRWGGIDASESFLVRCRVERGDASRAKFFDIDCAASHWRSANLFGAFFHNARFNLVDSPELKGRTFFDDCTLDHSTFQGAKMDHIYFLDCQFSHARLQGAQAPSSRWVRCTLRNTHFDHADISKAYFAVQRGERTEPSWKQSVASLSSQKSTPCDLTGATFKEAILKETDLSEAVGLTFEQLNVAADVKDMILPNEWKVSHPDWMLKLQQKGAVVSKHGPP